MDMYIQYRMWQTISRQCIRQPRLLHGTSKFGDSYRLQRSIWFPLVSATYELRSCQCSNNMERQIADCLPWVLPLKSAAAEIPKQHALTRKRCESISLCAWQKGSWNHFQRVLLNPSHDLRRSCQVTVYTAIADCSKNLTTKWWSAQDASHGTMWPA